jgi:polyisoprenoid-binding protein YceI
MKSVLFATAALAVLAAAPAPSRATTYTLLPNYTQVVFSWVHLGYSSPSAQLAQGQGSLEVDEQMPEKSSVRVELPLSSLHTGVPDLDEHLLSKDFFDAEHFPTASFVSTKVTKAPGKNHYKVMGDLTIHGITKPATLDMKMNGHGPNPRNGLLEMGFDGTLTVMRTEFGLGRFVPIVSDAVEMHLSAEAAEAVAYAAELKKEAEEQAKK